MFFEMFDKDVVVCLVLYASHNKIIIIYTMRLNVSQIKVFG